MSLHRLGIPVKLLGAPLRSHDSRRWQHAPHLSVSLIYLRDVFEYLHQRQIRFYRLAGQLAPYATHPNLPAFHRQIQECATELAATGDLARQRGLRLTMHPAHYIQLSTPDASLAAHSRAELGVAAALLDGMGLGADSVLVVHVGGVYDDPLQGRERFVRQWEQLPRPVRQRLALENDDKRYSFADTHWIHRRTGIPLVLDTLHLQCLNPDRRPLGGDACRCAGELAGPPDARKSTSAARAPACGGVQRNGVDHIQPPLPHQHSDFLDPFAFIELLRTVQSQRLRSFDIMLEAKAKDLALLRLREQVQHFAPELMGLLG